MSFDVLPTEMLVAILARPELRRVQGLLRCVCRGWRDVIRSRRTSSRLYVTAAQAGSVELLKWADDNGCPWLEQTAGVCAARHGHLHVLEWICTTVRGRRLNFDDLLCSTAICGQLSVMKWLVAHGAKPRKCAARHAAEHDHLDVIVWLRDVRKQVLDKSVCTCAARGGRVRMLEWLRSQGVPWDLFACISAAKNGHLETLKWLVAAGCPHDVEVTIAAARRRNHVDVVDWLAALQ